MYKHVTTGDIYKGRGSYAWQKAVDDMDAFFADHYIVLFWPVLFPLNVVYNYIGTFSSRKGLERIVNAS